MYDPNNYSYSDGRFEPVEPEIKKKSKGGAGKVIAALLAVMIVGGASGYGGAYLANMNRQETAVSANANAEKAPVTSSAPQPVTSTAMPAANTSKELESGYTTAEVIEKVTPSVVLITSASAGAGTSTGTGIVFTSDGYIVTNAHVVNFEQTVRTNGNSNSNSPYGYSDPFSSFFENFYGFGGGNNYETVVVEAEEVSITLSDGTEYEAKIVGSDANTDLAVLKIDAQGLTPADIGDSSSLVMGDTAITLGYPLGLGLSASDGIISGLDKEMSVEVAGGSVSMTLLQTDAAINSGNSGGPLLNNMGQVVGITSSKLSGSSIDGVGFAIPITDALPLINELMTTGEVKNTVPKIGITGMDITSAVQRYYGLPMDSGVLVSAVEPGSCAEAAGIAEGDVIVGADGKDVTNMEELIALKNKHKAGETMIITLARNDGNIDVELTLDVDE